MKRSTEEKLKKLTKKLFKLNELAESTGNLDSLEALEEEARPVLDKLFTVLFKEFELE